MPFKLRSQTFINANKYRREQMKSEKRSLIIVKFLHTFLFNFDIKSKDYARWSLAQKCFLFSKALKCRKNANSLKMCCTSYLKICKRHSVLSSPGSMWTKHHTRSTTVCSSGIDALLASAVTHWYNCDDSTLTCWKCEVNATASPKQNDADEKRHT